MFRPTISQLYQQYFDSNASTIPLTHLLIRQSLVRELANPSSMHRLGRMMREYIEETREVIAELLAMPEDYDVVFTSGGTEANNLAIKGRLVKLLKQDPKRIWNVYCSAIEHPSVLKTVKALEQWWPDKVNVQILPVDKQGAILIEAARETFEQAPPDIVSVMLVNNETGVIQPVRSIIKLAKQYNPDVFVHSDFVQAIGKIRFPILEYYQDGLDAFSLSAHKFYAPKGTGALIVKRDMIEPIQHGGHQEMEYRAGTENVMGIYQMGQALEWLVQPMSIGNRTMLNMYEEIHSIRDYFEQELVSRLGDNNVIIFGQQARRAPHVSYFGIKGFKGHTIAHRLNLLGFSVGTGSACSSSDPSPSHVLKAMGYSDDIAHQAIRVSFSVYNHKLNDAERLLRVIEEVVSEEWSERGSDCPCNKKR